MGEDINTKGQKKVSSKKLKIRFCGVLCDIDLRFILESFCGLVFRVVKIRSRGDSKAFGGFWVD
jgi:hypothetical protein